MIMIGHSVKNSSAGVRFWLKSRLEGLVDNNSTRATIH